VPPGLVHKSTCQRCVFVFTTPSPPAQRGGAKLCPSQTCRGVSPVGSPEVTRQSQDGRGRAKAQGVVTLRLGLRRWLSNRGRLGIVRPSHPQVWVWKGGFSQSLAFHVWWLECPPLGQSTRLPSESLFFYSNIYSLRAQFCISSSSGQTTQGSSRKTPALGSETSPRPRPLQLRNEYNNLSTLTRIKAPPVTPYLESRVL